MQMFNKTALTLTFLLSSLLSSNAYAAVSPCLDGNTVICITENQIDENMVQYTIANNSEQQIYAFGVTNSNSSKAYSEENFWEGFQFSQKDWDRGISIRFFNVTGKDGERDIRDFKISWATGGVAGRVAEEGYTELGSFASLFGEEEDYVNFYWNLTLSHVEMKSNPLNPKGGYLDDFYFTGQANSNFAVFGASGNVLASNLEATAAVPEPETYAMFLAGLGLLGFAKRRKQA
jgi:hypothetical protein